MKTLIIVAHPQIENSTTQQFFKEGLAGFIDFTWHPIANEYQIDEEQELLQQADRIIFQFPLYWYSAPALLKQWIDDVFSVNQLDLTNKELGLVVSTGSPAKDFQAGGLEHFTMSEVLRPFEMLANKMKLRYLVPITVFQFAYLNKLEQQHLLIQYQQYVTLTNFDSFDSKIAWFSEILKQKSTDNSELEQIITVLEDNEDARHDLLIDVNQFKQDED